MDFFRFFKKSVGGFTLVELMVSLFIMSIATALLLANYPDSTLRIRLLNNTHGLALLVLEAQRRGSAVDTTDNSIGGYGVLMSLNTTSVTSPTKVILFSDSTQNANATNTAGLLIGDGIYDTSQSLDSIKGTINFEDNFPIGKICVSDDATSSFLCNNSVVLGGVSTTTTSLTISFERPNQTAHIYINNDTATDFSRACIQPYTSKTNALGDGPSGHVRSVLVYHSGMVTTSATPCE